MKETDLQKPRICRPIAVLVEGKDYWNLLRNAIQDQLEFDPVQLFDFCSLGIAGYINQLKLQPNFSDIRSIGIIRDAEDNAQHQVQSLKQTLANVGLAVPANPMTIAGVTPTVGFLVIPHGHPNGCLEDACLDAATDHTRMACAIQFAQCVDRPAANNNWRAKVKVHALIASGDNPAQTLGQSALSNLWDFAQPSLVVMLDFLRLLRDSRP